MNIINKFSLQKHDGEYESWPLKSSLYYCGEELGVEISGYVIDKKFELADYFLLFISWGCPFEETCEVYVLNKLKKLLVVTALGHPTIAIIHLQLLSCRITTTN